MPLKINNEEVTSDSTVKYLLGEFQDVSKVQYNGEETWSSRGWKTLIASSTTYSQGQSDLEGAIDNTLTRATFSGKISNSFNGYDLPLDISMRINLDSINGTYAGSGQVTKNYPEFNEYYNIEYGFTLNIKNGYIEFNPWGIWTEELSGNSGDVDTAPAFIKIDKLEQYY